MNSVVSWRSHSGKDDAVSMSRSMEGLLLLLAKAFQAVTNSVPAPWKQERAALSSLARLHELLTEVATPTVEGWKRKRSKNSRNKGAIPAVASSPIE